MARSIKEEIKVQIIPNAELVKVHSISEDRIAAMKNDPLSATLKRVIDTYDYIGTDLSEMMRDLSNNRKARD